MSVTKFRDKKTGKIYRATYNRDERPVIKVSGRKLTLNFHHTLNVWEAMLPVENDYATYMTFDKIEG